MVSVQRFAVVALLLPIALFAQAPRTHFLFPSSLYIPATGQFAGKGAFAIFINEAVSLAQNCTTDATVTPDPTGAIVVDPSTVHFSGGVFWFDVTSTTNQLTQFTLPVKWKTTCVSAPKVNAAAPVFSVLIEAVLTIFVGNGGGNAGDNQQAADHGDPVSTASGELHGFDGSPDLALGGPLTLEFRRYYGSLLSSLGPAGGMGLNWMHNFDVRAAKLSDRATVTLFRGNTVRFTPSGANWQLTPGEQLPYQLVAAGDGLAFLDPATNLVYTFNAAGGLIAVADRNGNTLTVTQSNTGPTKVEDGFGRKLIISYAGVPLRVSKVEDQTGRAANFVQFANTLASVTATDGTQTAYTYTKVGNRASLMTKETLAAGNTPFTQEYDGQGRVNRQIDSRSNATAIAYSTALPQTGSITDPIGGITQHVYDLPGDLTQAVDAKGAHSSYEYDSSNHRTATVDRRSGRTETTYDQASGLPASITDALGNKKSFTYAAQVQGSFTYYNLTSVIYPDQTSDKFECDAHGNLTKFTDRAGKASTFTYNSSGQVLTAHNPAGGTRTLTYNDDGTLATDTAASGDQTTFDYDALKRVSKITNADASTRQFTYDARDRLLTATDERGKQTTFVYTGNGPLADVTDPLNQTAHYAYDTDERLASVTDAAGKITANTRDAIGRISKVTDATGVATTFGYDALHRLNKVTDSSGQVAVFGYDAEGANTSLSDALNNTWHFTPDALGRTTGSADPLGNSTSTAYDSVGRLITSTDALGQAVHFTYDGRGLLAGTAGPENITAAFARNDLGLVTSITDPNHKNWNTAYDSSGRPTSDTDPLSRVTGYSYDNRQRLKQVAFPSGSATRSYDAAGNLTRLQYTDGTDLLYTYDGNNRLLTANDVVLARDANGRITGSNGLLIGRDGAGRLKSITYATGKTVTYEYDSRGLLSKVTDWAGGVMAFTYDKAGRMITASRPNGVATNLTYDAASRLAGIVWNGGAVNASIQLQRNAAGRVTKADRTLPQATVLTVGTRQQTFDAAHQVSGFTYDGTGRLTSGGGRTYTWDLASRLNGYQGAGGNGAFHYDASGLMTVGQHNFVWNYALDLPSIATARDGQADLRYYVHTPTGSLLYSIDAAGNQRHFYHFDETGTTMFLSGDDGAVTDSYAYTPYGEVTAHSGQTDNPFTFQGALGVMQIGDTGLYYMRARFYDAITARFLSRDPVRSTNPMEINPYQYAVANPVGYGDATGMKPKSLDATASFNHRILDLHGDGSAPAGNGTFGERSSFQGGDPADRSAWVSSLRDYRYNSLTGETYVQPAQDPAPRFGSVYIGYRRNQDPNAYLWQQLSRAAELYNFLPPSPFLSSFLAPFVLDLSRVIHNSLRQESSSGGSSVLQYANTQVVVV